MDAHPVVSKRPLFLRELALLSLREFPCLAQLASTNITEAAKTERRGYAKGHSQKTNKLKTYIHGP